MPMNEYGEIIRNSSPPPPVPNLNNGENNTGEPSNNSRSRATRAQREKAAKSKYTVSWVVFILYTALMNYYIWFNSAYMYDKINMFLVTVAYLFIIGSWAYFGGLSDNGIIMPLIPSLIFYVGLFSSSTGAVILENYYYRHTVNGTYESKMLHFLGANDFFVIKYMGVSILACLVVIIIPGYLGKSGRNRIINP